MGRMKDLEIFLQDFDSEFEWAEQVYIDKTGELEEVTVYVSKMGGGTVGEKYEGRWLYTLVGSGSSDPKVWGDDFNTGMPHSHRYVARCIAMIYGEGHFDEAFGL